ncbi:hypothetical protein OH76DRAFT_1560659 [Lentinus brumalis]|uniref:Uncharacterized protein n=1 Tax=Lentinus brumalis TaxID=2498619 RepID=A0A371CRM1_9APHY|nr:hypothetical protein OH76DRAFT_1560659 [Polyporus brumalis]
MPPVRTHDDTTPHTGLTFVYFDLQPPNAQDRVKLIKPDRDAVREELRAEWNEELRRLTGVADASLWWTTGTFPKRIVWKLGYTWALVEEIIANDLRTFRRADRASRAGRTSRQDNTKRLGQVRRTTERSSQLKTYAQRHRCIWMDRKGSATYDHCLFFSSVPTSLLF